MASRTRRVQGVALFSSARRIAAESVAACSIVIMAVGLATGGDARASVAQPGQSAASLSLSIVTPNTSVGPFTTSQPVPTAVDENGTARLPAASVSFNTVEVTLPPHMQFTVALVPAGDFTTSVNPASGVALVTGEVTMQWQAAGNVVCQVGPFGVNASTLPFSALPYSSSSGTATVVDAAPNVPAVSPACGGRGVVIDNALSLPIASTQPAAQSTPATPVAQTPPNPAIQLQVSFSPAIQRSVVPTATTATTATTSTTTAKLPLTAPPTVPADGSVFGKAPQQAASAPVSSDGGPSTHSASRTPHRHGTDTKDTKSVETTPTTAGLDPNLEPPPDPSLDFASTPAPTNPSMASAPPVALDPQSASTHGEGSTPVLVLLLIATSGAVAFGLRLIGSDVRRLIPARSRQAFGGPISVPSRTTSLSTNDTVTDVY